MPILQRVTGEDAIARVGAAVGDLATDVKDSHGHVDLVCEAGKLPDVMQRLRDADGLRCRFFTFLSGIDRTELEEDKTSYGTGLEVLVHVYSPEFGTHVNVHVPLPAENATCPTITGIYMGAFWHERECHEMFGIDFEGHPKLVNLYLTEDFEGHPGLKSFKLPARTTVKDWPGAKDPEEAAAGGH